MNVQSEATPMPFHFISGLPRSGSTLLAAILNQNPRFKSSIMSPVGHVLTTSLQAMGPNNEADMFIQPEQKRAMLKGLVLGFYQQSVAEVIFDNNRRWCANIGLLGEIFPDCKVICCVRSPAAIVDSFERLFQKNPLSLSPIFGSLANLTVFERVHELMKPTGVLGFALNAFSSAFYGPHRERIIGVSYDDLCRFPKEVMAEVHSAIGEPPFDYDFGNILPITGAADFDRKINTPGLHDLKPAVVYEPRQSVLPPEIFNALPPPFWQVKEAVTATH